MNYRLLLLLAAVLALAACAPCAQDEAARPTAPVPSSTTITQTTALPPPAGETQTTTIEPVTPTAPTAIPQTTAIVSDTEHELAQIEQATIKVRGLKPKVDVPEQFIS